mmetsp:Transcript_34613/g.52950  ORF Transcript_34613/g.52950 Transcript_34613/m.52950 type:complete len:127 (-) Transcript_34613:68-448(-)
MDSFDTELVSLIDSKLNISSTVDPEVKTRWYRLGIMKDYKPAFPLAHKFLSDQGKMKFIQPLYRALLLSGNWRLADKWLKENKDFYHPTAYEMVDALIAKYKKEAELQETRENLIASLSTPLFLKW